MAWTLMGFGTLPLDVSTPRVTYTEDSPGFRKGIKWTRKAHGDCMQMVFHANPEVVDFQVREVVSLEVDGASHFSGVIVKHPGHHSKGAGPNDPDSMDEYIVYGMSQIVKETLMPPVSAGDGGTLSNSVYLIARYVAQTVLAGKTRHQALNIPFVSGELSQFYMPYYPVNQVLDALAQSVPGVDWGVNHNGFLYFHNTATQHNLNYTNDALYIEWIPINAEELVTGVTLIVATEPSAAVSSLKYGRLVVSTGTGFAGTYAVHLYSPKPEVIEYADPVYHPIYGARISRLMGHLLLADNTLVAAATKQTAFFTDTANAYDGDPDTYMTGVTDGPGAEAYLTYAYGTYYGNAASAKTIIGCRIVYEHNHPSGDGVRVSIYKSDDVLSPTMQQFISDIELPATGSPNGLNKRIVDFIFPEATIFDTGRSDVLTLSVRSTDNLTQVRVYQFVPIYLDVALGTEIAKSLLRLPAQDPSVITVRNQLLEPRRRVYITDVPSIESGILEGDASEYEYTVSPEDGRMTQIKFEQPDLSDETLIAKHMSQELDSQVIGQVRSVGKNL